MAVLSRFSNAGAEAILLVHAALTRYAPHLVAHFDEAVTEVIFAPELCPEGSAACATPNVIGRVVFRLPAEYMTMGELARVLLHEARHWQYDPYQGWYTLPHSCSEPFCRNPDERAADFVYAKDLELQPQIDFALLRAGLDPHRPYRRPPAPSASGPHAPLVVSGAALGAVIGGPVGALVGGFVGALFD